MPRPREEDEDLFHDEADVEFEEDSGEEEKPKKKTAKKKTAKKKTAKKKAAPKKKTTKKKKKVVVDDDAPVVKKAKKKKAKRKTAKKKAAGDDGFGAGLFDEPKEAEPVENEVPPVEEEVAAEAVEEPAPEAEPVVEEPAAPAPVADHVVHIYELGRFKRTIERDFTQEAAEAYATEFSRTSKRYGRQAVAADKQDEPATMLESA